MKKLVIIHHVANVGGGTISLVDMCKMLCSTYEVVVLIPNRNPKALTEMLSQYATVKYYSGVMPQIAYYSGSNTISFGFLKTLLGKKKDIAELVDLITKENPDILLANSIVQCVMGKHLKNIPAKKFIYIRETFKETKISDYIIDLINQYFDGVFCISPYEKEYAKFKIPCEVVADCFVPYKKNTSSFDLNPNKFNVLFMGGISEIKGLSVLLDSVAYTKSENVNYVICGNLSYIGNSFKNRILHGSLVKRDERMKAIIEGNPEKMKLMGFVSDTESLIRQCDVMVFPSTVPHQARPAIEAGFSHKPVIMSGFKQTECFYQHNYNCLTFKPNDPVDLAKQIDALASDEALAKRIGETNYQTCQEQHNFELEQKKMLDFLSKHT